MRVEPAEFLHRNLGNKATQANKDAVLTKKHVIEQWICVYIEMDLGFDGMFSLKTEFGFEGGERIMYVS